MGTTKHYSTNGHSTAFEGGMDKLLADLFDEPAGPPAQTAVPLPLLTRSPDRALARALAQVPAALSSLQRAAGELRLVEGELDRRAELKRRRDRRYRQRKRQEVAR